VRGIDFRILGPLEAAQGERLLPLGTGRQRTLLAILLLNANEVVSSDRLVDGLWGERPPETAGKALQNHVSQLRKLLGHDALVTAPPGYALRIDPLQIDATRFERLVAEAREQEPADAAASLRQALALWRGSALAEFADEEFARAEALRLEELRLRAIEARIDAELALGGHADVVAELETLVARHPLRERLRAQSMLALYRSGRQAEALDAYADARRTLADELGLEPGEELKQLQRAILTHDPVLAPPPPRTPAPTARRRRTRPLLAVAALVLTGGMAAAAVELSAGGSKRVTVLPNSIAAIDPASDRVTADVPVGARPVALAAGADAVWVVNADDGTLSRIDPKTAREVARIGVGTEEAGLAIGYGSVWVAGGNDGTIARVDADSNVLQAKLTIGRGSALTPEPVFAVATGAGGVWATRGDSLVRIDPATNRVVASFAVARPSGLIARGGAVWVTSSADRLLRIDSRTGAVTARLALPAQAVAPTLSADSLWFVVRLGGGQIWQLNAATSELIGTTRTSDFPIDLAWGAGALWAANENTPGSVWRIEASGRVSARIVVGHEVTAVAVDGGRVWTAVAPTT
jgi:DNA-binding SARP family transcriptional activator/DNA-binding beta-propeller fold protein YncE